jgi:hypothetical protein
MPKAPPPPPRHYKFGNRPFGVRTAAWRNSATPDEMPPLFTDNVTTRSLAILYHHGAMSMPLLKAVRPAMRTKDIMDGFAPLLKAGILLKYQVKAINGQPIIYALNQKHAFYQQTNYLLRRLWLFVEPKLTYVPRTPFKTFPELHFEADGGFELYRHRNLRTRIGSVLHFLAEFDVPIEMKSIIELLGFPTNHLILIFARLQAFGLIRDRYAMGERYVQIDQGHPLGTPLINWIRRANQTADLQKYRTLADIYTRRKINGELDRAYRAWIKKHGRFLKKHLPHGGYASVPRASKKLKKA